MRSGRHRAGSSSPTSELLIGNEQQPLGLFLKGMWQDRDGELYVLAGTALGPYGDTGAVFRIVPASNP